MQARVLFFDSGVGGLTVLTATRERCPQLELSYLFDNACFPYGEKSEEFLITRVGMLLTTACRELKPDLMVIACNTASTVALPAVRKMLSVPIVGVVPAIKPAAAVSKRKIIGLLATPGTIKRHYTQDLIENFAAHEEVLRIGTTKLVEIAEAKLQGKKPDLKEIAAILAPWLSLPREKQPDVVVLGCTHYPWLREEISAVLGAAVTLIDSGDAVARRVESLLQNMTLPQRKLKSGSCAIYCTKLDDSLDARVQALAPWGIDSIHLLPGLNTKTQDKIDR